MTLNLKTAYPADILARTLVGEARGEGRKGMEAVACVAMNRVRKKGWWGATVKMVCLMPSQFSCWNPADPNRKIIMELDDSVPIYRDALGIAGRAISGDLKDFTNGATHYFAKDMKHPPAWARNLEPCFTLGKHVFYNNVP